MAEMQPEMQPPEMQREVQGGQDVSRRRMLIAAAAAPFVATIPNGAAWSTSVVQCVATSGSDSSDATLSVASPRPTSDRWVRRLAYSGQFTPPGGGADVQLWSFETTLPRVNWLDSTGTTPPKPVNTGDTTCGTQEYCLVGGVSAVYVLVVYQATPSPANADNVVMIGPYPQAQLGGNNIGLYGSCLCSVAPGALPSGLTCPL